MLRYLLDTNIVIFALRNRHDFLRDRFTGAQGTIAVSVVTVAELVYGAERSSSPAANQSAVDDFLAQLEVLDLSAAAAQHAGRIRAELASLGTPIGAFDTLIAGHARTQGLTVVTNNTREFNRVNGLLVEDWSS